jgi:hypothetical protein
MVGLRVRDWTDGEIGRLSSDDEMEFRYFKEGRKQKFLERFFFAAVEGVNRNGLN